MIHILFNSYIFLFGFLPVVFAVYYSLNKLNKFKLASTFLIIASLVFYGYDNINYLFIIISSILINYSLGSVLYKKSSIIELENNNKNQIDIQRKILLILGCIFNLGLLGYFKYYNFFISNLNNIFKLEITFIQVALPLGISFFTFQQLSYLIDNYKCSGKKYDFLEYTLFVCFFPQLVAGPIVLPQEIIPQFENKLNRFINYKNISQGIFILTIGLFKKIMIADILANIVNPGFSNVNMLNSFEAWFVTLAYTLQLYFDFSGYWDMACGIALMFNIKLPMNFNSPYKSLNIQDFWKRWHMTLGRFLTKYLYIPLGGSRVSKLKWYRNLLIVFLASGIWHGAGWPFIIWGLLHGIASVIYRIFKQSKYTLNKYISWFITFIFVNLAWVFFRSPDIYVAMEMIKKLVAIDFTPLIYIAENGLSYINIITQFPLLEIIDNIYISIFIFIISVVIIFLKNSVELKANFKGSCIEIISTIILFTIVLINMNNISEFLYFNF